MALLALSAGCWADPGLERAGDAAIDISVGLSPTPPMTGSAQIRVTVEDGGAPLTPGARVLAGLAGDGSAAGDPDPRSGEGDQVPAAELTLQNDGGWTGELHFPAPGVALVEIRVVRLDGTGATLRVPVTVSRRPAG
jgi:hypothetical protein